MRVALRSLFATAVPRFHPSQLRFNNNFHTSLRAMSDPAPTPTIFDKILSKEIPSTKVYEDDLAYAFRDISPTAPTHVLIIPKVKDGLSSLSKAEERHKDILGHLLYVAKLVAESENIAKSGYRIVINDGPQGCQSVYHIHVHLIGGKQLTWPPGV